jgi:hypothetical protein
VKHTLTHWVICIELLGQILNLLAGQIVRIISRLFGVGWLLCLRLRAEPLPLRDWHLAISAGDLDPPEVVGGIGLRAVLRELPVRGPRH